MIEYRVIQDDTQLREMVNTLRRYAHSHPLDKQFIDDIESTSDNAEQAGPFMRVRNKEGSHLLRDYTIFVSLDGTTPLQISYYEYPVREDTRACQLTIVDNNESTLDEGQKTYLINTFFGQDSIVPDDLPTPPHVAIAFKLEPYFDATVN